MATKAAAITEKSIPTIEQLATPEVAEEGEGGSNWVAEYVKEGQLAAPDGQSLVPMILVTAYVLVQVAPCICVCTVKTQPLSVNDAVEPSV